MSAKKITAKPVEVEVSDEIAQMAIAYHALMKIPREYRAAAIEWLNARLEADREL
jgi:hypothetical protein